MNFFANQEIEHENQIGQEILALATNEIESIVYAGGNSMEIYAIKIYKNATYKHLTTIKVL
jgi:hypothetical protein